MSSQTLQPSLAEMALRHSPIPALRKLLIEETADVIVLQGKVSSYYHKQLAQETIMPMLGKRQLSNRVAVDGTVAAVG
jgi:hypothetical protein